MPDSFLKTEDPLCEKTCLLPMYVGFQKEKGKDKSSSGLNNINCCCIDCVDKV